jgi:hypothetical protein
VNSDDSQFEVVFVSSDNDVAEFKSYFTEVHGDWLALPYEASTQLRKDLKIKYGFFGAAGACSSSKSSANPGLTFPYLLSCSDANVNRI